MRNLILKTKAEGAALPPLVLRIIVALVTVVFCAVPARATPFDLQAEMRAAEADGKMLVLDFWAEWCPWCKDMDSTLRDPAVVGSLSRDFVYRKIDVTKDVQNWQLNNRLQKEYEGTDDDETGVPYTIIFSSGRVIKSFVGYRPPETYHSILELAALHHQVESEKLKNAIVYAAVDEMNDQGELVVSVSRVSTNEMGETGVWETVSESPMPLGKLNYYLSIIRNGDAERIESLLAADLIGTPPSGTPPIGSTKTIFFKNLSSASINPSSIGLKNASSVINGDSFDRRTGLQEQKKENDFQAYLGYPLSDEDFNSVFKRDPAKLKRDPAKTEVDTWKDSHQKLVTSPQMEGVRVFDANDTKKLASKQAFLDELAASGNFIILSVHSNGRAFVMPGKDSIEISPSDIESIHFKKRPFVFARLCEATAEDNRLFARAFIQAGASGVCINSGKIYPSVAQEHILSFLKNLRLFESIDGAIAALPESQKSVSTLYTETTPNGGQRIAASLLNIDGKHSLPGEVYDFLASAELEPSITKREN